MKLKKENSKITTSTMLSDVKMRLGITLYNLGRRLMCENHEYQQMYNLGGKHEYAYSICKICGKKIVED